MLYYSPDTALMAGLGLSIHFVSRWAEHWRSSGRSWPWTYAALDVPGWLFAGLSALAAYLVLPEFGGIVGQAISTSPGGALLAGYTASSLGVKLPTLLGRGGAQ